MKAQPVIDRLKDQCPTLERRVHHVATVSEIKYPEIETPMALVMTLPPTYSQNDGMGGVHNQPMRRRTAVFLRGTLPTDEHEPMPDASDEIVAALVGWPGDERWFEVESVEPETPNGQLTTWILTFTYQDYERAYR